MERKPGRGITRLKEAVSLRWRVNPGRGAKQMEEITSVLQQGHQVVIRWLIRLSFHARTD